jgi:chaperonin GroEL
MTSVASQRIVLVTGATINNAATDTYGELVTEGVIDFAKVVRSVPENAGLALVRMLISRCLVAKKPKEEKGAADPHAGHCHGGF